MLAFIIERLVTSGNDDDPITVSSCLGCVIVVPTKEYLCNDAITDGDGVRC